MPAAYEMARDALVGAMQEHIDPLRELKKRMTALQDLRALSAIIDAFDRYEAAWAQNQRSQTDVR